MSKKAIIIGAGPAGLTAALELLRNTNIKPVIYEMTSDIGGISKTVNYKGNRIDIGGHRFFSKSDRVMEWWKGICSQRTDGIFLLRQRVSRIFYLRKFFDYPVSLSMEMVLNLGFIRLIRIMAGYVWGKLFPIKEEKNLEDFFINRFGRQLYLTFFKDYTEKVWGVPCNSIKPDWGAQRIKGLSVSKALGHAIKTIFIKDKSIGQKANETSLIGQFMYPKLGPGQFWEEVARMIMDKGGEIYLNQRVMGLGVDNGSISCVKVKDQDSGQIKTEYADYFLSTMPIKDLMFGLEADIPGEVRRVAEGLRYRDFITVGLLLQKLKIKNNTKIKTPNNLIPDNWIYVQERDVLMGRIQIFNNWSPYMVQDPDKVWVGLEYFCNEGDELWNMPDAQMKELARQELVKIGFIDDRDVLDSVVLRVPKAYPAYFGTYERFDLIKEYISRFQNLFLIGRNGMHCYNNMDHSMMTAIMAVQNILEGIISKDNIWSVNTEQEYNEEEGKNRK
ncbi:MAG: NAD(P)/FAD-dependent oxidoreductase [Candidatus Omnitrophica bacterium]|nr:NAD(P)/FAD-dependent oxidoreductase [Candidatus Omnitrophota bacterium]